VGNRVTRTRRRGECFENMRRDAAARVDLSRFRAVSIWCVEAKANFTTAPLTLQ